MNTVTISDGQRLTPTEFVVLGLAAQGWSNSKVAELAHMGESAAAGHLSRIYHKLGLHGDQRKSPRVSAVLWFISENYHIIANGEDEDQG